MPTTRGPGGGERANARPALATAVLVVAAVAAPGGTLAGRALAGGSLSGPPRVAREPVELWTRSLDVSARGVALGSAADLDSDGLDELMFHVHMGGDSSELVVLGGTDGSELWRVAFPGRSRVLAVDVGSDGRKEVVAACGDDLSVLDGATGERLGGCALEGHVGDIACGRGAAGPFLVCTSGEKHDDTMVVVSGEGLRELWRVEAVRDRGPAGKGFTFPVALDVNGDGRDEVLVAENGNRLLCFAGSGELRWDVGLGRNERLNPEGVVSSLPVVADLLGDGVLELAVGCFAGDVVVMDAAAGEVLDRARYGVDSHEKHMGDSRVPGFIKALLGRVGEPVNCLTPVELDGGPGLELVLGCSDEHVYAFDPGRGATIWRVGTRETVYEPCLQLDEATILAWDTTGAYVIDRVTGSVLDRGFEFGATMSLLACEIDGSAGLEVVHVALDRSEVAAWDLGVGGAAPTRDGGPAVPEDAAGEGARERAE